MGAGSYVRPFCLSEDFRAIVLRSHEKELPLQSIKKMTDYATQD